MANWSFSFTGTDHFTVEGGHLHCVWATARNQFELDDLCEWSVDTEGDLYDCGEVIAVEFNVGDEKDLIEVVIKTKTGQAGWQVASLLPKGVSASMYEQKYEALVAELRQLWKNCPAELRKLI